MQHVGESMLSLDSARLRQYVQSRFGSIARLQTRWPPSGPAPNRSTLTRWLNGQTFPRTSEDLLIFSGVLDIDPFGLWSFDPQGYKTLFRRSRKALMRNDWSNLLPTLAFIERFFDRWPPDIAERYFSREWILHDISYPAKPLRSEYIAFEIRPFQGGIFHEIQVWHFAWKHPDTAAWSPYGWLRLAADEVKIWSVTGQCDSVQRSGSDFGRLLIATWLGPGAVTFGVASLHPFECSIVSSEDAMLSFA